MDPAENFASEAGEMMDNILSDSSGSYDSLMSLGHGSEDQLADADALFLELEHEWPAQ